MIRPLIVGFLIAISNSAWGACTIYTTNPPIAGPCDDAPVFPAAGIADPERKPLVIPGLTDTPFMLKSGPLSSMSLLQIPCCVSFATKAGTITMDLDNGTIDLHGTKLDDAARAFWDAVAQVAGHPAVKQRAYTLGDIDRMRAALEATMTRAIIIDGRSACSQPNSRGLTEVNCPPADAAQVEDRLRTYLAAGITPEELEARVK